MYISLNQVSRKRQRSASRTQAIRRLLPNGTPAPTRPGPDTKLGCQLRETLRAKQFAGRATEVVNRVARGRTPQRPNIVRSRRVVSTITRGKSFPVRQCSRRQRCFSTV